MLELGAGAGRDTLCLAAHGFAVTAVDYAPSALRAIQRAAHTRQIAERITSTQHDLRTALPFADATFDACYSHMLYCMAFSDEELAFLSAEVLRVQADAARWRRGDNAARKGASATIKMTIPMVLFIFPTIWLVLLGPAVFSVFKGGF